MSFNNRFLTVEDTNSIIEHFGKAVSDYYIVDTKLFDTLDFWFTYDFITVSKSTGSFDFEIHNSLWTGGYYVFDSNINDYTVSVDDFNLTVSGSGLEYVVLVLELSTNYNLTGSTSLNVNPYFTPVIRPFYETINIKPVFVDKTDNPVANLDVTTKDGVKKTNNNGEVSINYSINSGGDYTADMSVTQANSIVESYKFPFIRLKTELPIILLNNHVYKDKKQVLSFKFLSDTNISDTILFTENNIRLTINNKVYTVDSYNNGVFNFFVDLEDYFYDTINLRLNISGNDYIEAYSLDIKADLVFESLDNVSDLKIAIVDPDGADTIYYSGVELNDQIQVNRDVRIVFTEPVINSIPDKCFIISEGASLVLDGLDYTGEAGLIDLINGNVKLTDSNIHNVLDTLIKGDGTVILKDSVFSDNTGVVDAVNVDVYNSSFSLNDAEMLKDDVLAFIKVTGECKLDYSRFELILTDMDSIPYVFVDIGKDAIVDTIKSKELSFNESFPVKKCTSEVNVETSRAVFTGKSNKCFLWTIEDSNTVYSNLLGVEYV